MVQPIESPSTLLSNRQTPKASPVDDAFFNNAKPVTVNELKSCRKVSFNHILYFVFHQFSFYAFIWLVNYICTLIINQEATFIVYATVNNMAGEGDWWYPACRCNKKMYADEGVYFCDKCNKYVVNVTPR